MSLSGNWHETERWLQTAEEDFKAAQTLAEHHLYAQACFYAQQMDQAWRLAGSVLHSDTLSEWITGSDA